MRVAELGLIGGGKTETDAQTIVSRIKVKDLIALPAVVGAALGESITAETPDDMGQPDKKKRGV